MAIKQRLKIAEICFPIGMKPLPGQHLPAVNMAEGLLETVDRLQSRLMESPEPRKLLKTLKRLGELPMTVDILVETGVGKTVNSFRKHEVAAEVAKGLVAKWKKLVPQPANRSSSNHAKEVPLSHSRGSSDAAQRRQRGPSPEVEEEDEEEPSYVEEDEERGYDMNYSPSPPRHEQYSPQRPGGDQYDSPKQEPEPEPSPSPRRDAKHAKLSKSDRNHHHSEQRQRHAPAGRDGGACGEGKKRSTDRERSPPPKPAKRCRKSHEGKSEEARKGGDNGRLLRAQKDSPAARDAEEDAFETPTMSFESFLTYDAPTSSFVKKKKKKTTTTSSHSRPSHASAAPAPSSCRTSQPASSSSSSSCSSSKTSKANGATSTKKSHSDSASAAPGKRRKVVEPLPSLPEIPLPDIQPNYRPLPSIDITPLSPQRRKGPVYNDEEDAGFTGKRFNSKMVVYSGSKTSYLPRMMTLYEQCIRVLQNNIDSIAEVGGVPFTILQPVLERCTPEQLYRIEQSNQWFTEESDELWMRHCQRDFKRESPQEYESWRELYLRLHDEREARLRRLTQNISSAHANKPKGRQVKIAFVNSAAKPPRDVRRRQEKFGTTNGSSADSTAAATPIKIRPASNDYSVESSRSSSSLLNPTPSSSRSSAITAGGGGATGGGHASREKPQVKKIAPMMAKTIKAFKNRFSRR
ncbi:elongin-A isoform X2 [Dunckerocampus dactyliophorus]|uniref:elongin-A isoform X2 n=1 Tax=Dunckerocampus dactyliophorus TaxID=161453 RepID=UPI002404FC69|nr:elongin-A isoform X2 [Dunckerocampus dactyliophorus]